MQSIKLGLLGCGTVGGGVATLLRDNARYLAERVGAPLEIRRVLVRDGEKPRVDAIDRKLLVTDPERVLADTEIDVFIETLGGIEPARTYVHRALASKRSVVTANKMLLQAHGAELLAEAVARGVDLAFEASVGGGIPIIRTLREAFASDWVTSLFGIVNGTCNYVLTRMQQDGSSFADAVREAQAKGYAEADPELDVGGHDAAHKLAILAMLAFGARVSAREIPTEGIKAIEPIDHEYAKRFGYVIKHLACGYDHDTHLELRVHPTLVARDTPLANVSGVLNAIALEGRALGPCLLSGRGAGDMPTAVSVVADVLDVARAARSGAAGLATRGIQMEPRPLLAPADVRVRFYLRFEADSATGGLAAIAHSLAQRSIAVREMVQESTANGRVHILMLTETAREGDVRAALAEIEAARAARAAHVIRVL